MIADLNLTRKTSINMHEVGYTYNTFLRDMHGKYKDFYAELNVEILKGKDYYEYYHDNFDDVVLSQKT